VGPPAPVHHLHHFHHGLEHAEVGGERVGGEGPAGAGGGVRVVVDGPEDCRRAVSPAHGGEHVHVGDVLVDARARRAQRAARVHPIQAAVGVAAAEADAHGVRLRDNEESGHGGEEGDEDGVHREEGGEGSMALMWAGY